MASRDYSISEARSSLPRLVRQAEKGATVALTRRGKRVAVLVSAAEYDRMTRVRADLWEAIQRFRTEHDLSALDIDEIYGDVRDRTPGRAVDL